MIRSIMCATVVSILWATQAQALRIVNLTTNTVLFNSGGFENDTPGTHPNASIGTWTTTNADYTGVTNNAAPGPFSGDNYAFGARDLAGQGNLQADFANQTTVGDVINMRFMLHASGPHAIFVYHNEEGEDAEGNPINRERFRIRLVANGSVQVWDVGAGGYVNTTLTQAAGTWQYFEIEYEIGSDSFRLRVNDQPWYTSSSQAVLGANAGEAGIPDHHVGSIFRLQFRHVGAGPNYYVDAPVPEPAGMALLGAGVLMLMRRRRAVIGV